MLTGEFTRKALEEDDFKDWYHHEYETYEVEKSKLKGLKDLRNYRLEVFVGTWCPDSRRELPRLYKILDDIKFPQNRLKVIGVNRQKKSFNGEEINKNVTHVPTIIVYNNKKEEVGRIVESPVSGYLEEDLAQIVEAGLYAASGMGRQSAIIVAVTNKELRDQLAKTNAEIMGKPDFDPFYGAPAILIVLADKSCRTAIYDGSLVMGNMMLAAHSLGLGSIWIHRAKEEFERPEYQQLLKKLGVEGEWEGIGHCAVGYIDGEAPKAAKRKDNRVFWIE